ncbi:hypothetical protein Peur_060398 [Populus x canadensis]
MGVRFASNLIGKPMNFPMWCSSIGIQFTVIGFYHVPGFRLFRRPLLAQPTDVPWLRLRDAAPVRDLRFFSMIRSFVSFQRSCWFFFFFGSTF